MALRPRAENGEGARRCVAHRDQRAIGQHEADGGGTIFARIHAIEKIGGEKKRFIFSIESRGAFDFLHFLPRRDFERERLLHRAFFRRCWVQQVNPDGAAEVFAVRHLTGGFPGAFGQGGGDVRNRAFARTTAAILNGPGCQHGAGPPRGEKGRNLLTLARQPE